jgi:signal transduction histidine kinase
VGRPYSIHYVFKPSSTVFIAKMLTILKNIMPTTKTSIGVEYAPLILIVDDSATNIQLLIHTLETEYRIKTALGGQIALDIANEDEKPDLILLDIMMPDMDGYEVCRRLHESPETCNIPIIFVTAKHDSWDQAQGFSSGGVDYITKPFDLLVVRARVRTHVNLGITERRLQESRTQIRELAAHREKVRENERKHIAREMHDELGQLLSSLHLQVQIVRAQFGEGIPAMGEKLQYMMNLLDKTQQVVRDITSALRPAALDMGLVSALEWQAQEFSTQTGIPCSLHVTTGDIHLDDDQAVAILRIVQESLTNVMRHADASEVEIQLNKQEGCWALQVRDNGAGFSSQSNNKKKSFGLVGIQERALMLGGCATITSAPQQGTVLNVRIPIDEKTGEL